MIPPGLEHTCDISLDRITTVVASNHPTRLGYRAVDVPATIGSVSLYPPFKEHTVHYVHIIPLPHWIAMGILRKSSPPKATSTKANMSSGWVFRYRRILLQLWEHQPSLSMGILLIRTPTSLASGHGLEHSS